MQFHKQLFGHFPKAGVVGDCYRTCIACLLDLNPRDVPHFLLPHLHDGEVVVDNHIFYKDVEGFLNPLGYTILEVAYPGTNPLKMILDTIETQNGNVYYILGGTSHTGCGHVVIYCGNKLIWDPSPLDVGIQSPMEDGNYWLTFLLPLKMRPECRKFTLQDPSPV